MMSVATEFVFPLVVRAEEALPPDGPLPYVVNSISDCGAVLHHVFCRSCVDYVAPRVRTFPSSPVLLSSTLASSIFGKLFFPSPVELYSTALLAGAA